MKLIGVCLVAVMALAVSATAALKPKPWQWTTAQASAAIMRQAEDFYLETTDLGYKMPRDLTAARCRGTGKAAGRRFVTFACTATFNRGVSDPVGTVRVLAKTRRAGGLCWSTAPARIPSGCFSPGKRAEGNVAEAWRALYKVLDDRAVQNQRCEAHGAGFFTCTWTQATGEHRGTVIFSPAPVAKVLA